MKTYRASLKSVSPYSQSRPNSTDKLEKESADAFEKRTWREKSHTDETGQVVIPGICFKKALEETAAYLSEKIPGKRNATWTKNFMAGVLVVDSLPLKVQKADLESEVVFCNADGKKGSGTRVWRWFPVIRQWEGKLDFIVLDDTITLDAFRHHLEEAGKFIGIGRWRPRQGGMFGRFEVIGVKEV
ncbi:MAG: hypothetical protein AABY46_06625 [Nitrospirota bacterium]